MNENTLARWMEFYNKTMPSGGGGMSDPSPWVSSAAQSQMRAADSRNHAGVALNWAENMASQGDRPEFFGNNTLADANAAYVKPQIDQRYDQSALDPLLRMKQPQSWYSRGMNAMGDVLFPETNSAMPDPAFRGQPERPQVMNYLANLLRGRQ